MYQGKAKKTRLIPSSGHPSSRAQTERAVRDEAVFAAEDKA
jgi:hypothetical protein